MVFGGGAFQRAGDRIAVELALAWWIEDRRVRKRVWIGGKQAAVLLGKRVKVDVMVCQIDGLLMLQNTSRFCPGQNVNLTN